MASLVADAAAVEFGGREPWPQDVLLFQPYEAGQILVPDYAACLSVKAFLEFCGLDYKVELRTNAEHISPSGKVPFLKAGPLLVSEFDPIVAFANTKGGCLGSALNDVERAEMKAYMALVENILVPAELYLSWCDDEQQVTRVTKHRYGSPYAWPLNVILPWKKQREVCKQLNGLGWLSKNMDEVCEELRTCCIALSQKLGDQEFFFGNQPMELDALVYGHLFTLITTELPNMRFADIIESFQNLVDLCTRIDDKHFKHSEPES